jgi:hypothetical protein
MGKPEYEFHLPAAEWLPADGPVRGIWRQVLAEDPTTGAYTGLIRYEPGVDTTPNGVARHDYWEEVYILEGDFTDLTLGEAFGPGMYACRPAGMAHGPWRTEAGALILEIRYPASPDAAS